MLLAKNMVTENFIIVSFHTNQKLLSGLNILNLSHAFLVSPILNTFKQSEHCRFNHLY